MNRDPILVRVDATPESGYERLSRCLVLAAALQRRRRPVYFMSDLDPGSIAFAIKKAGNEWIAADHRAGSENDATDVLREIHRLNPAAVIVDEADITRGYLNEIASSGPLLVNFDHHASIHFPSQLLVNPLLGPSKESYEIDTDSQILMGRRYSLVRPEIRRHRPSRAQEPAPLLQAPGKAASGQFRALLALGEDDPNRQVLDLAKLLLNTPKVGKVDVIVRREHPDLEQLQALAESMPERLEIALEMNEITARLTRCHFAITAGTGWSLELACLGLPQLLLVQNEAHWSNAQRLEEEGCASCLGWHESVTAQTIRLAIQNLLSDPLERQAMSRCGRKLIDGRGPDRLVTALEVMLHRSPMTGMRQAA